MNIKPHVTTVGDVLEQLERVGLAESFTDDEGKKRWRASERWRELGFASADDALTAAKISEVRR